MFATIAQQRMDARAEFQQGEEQSKIRELIKTDYSFADLLHERLLADSRDVFKWLDTAYQGFCIRKMAEASNEVSLAKLYRLSLDLAEEFEHFLTKEEFEMMHKKLVEGAIDHETEIFKQAKERV